MSRNSNIKKEKKKKEYIQKQRKLIYGRERVNPVLLKRIVKDQPGDRNLKIMKQKYKASAVILDFAQPFLDDSQTEDETQEFIELAISCWNLTVLPEDKVEEFLNSVKENNGSDDPFYEVINLMIKRKNELFSDYDFIIMDHEITFYENGNLNLSVAAEIINLKELDE